MKENKILIIGLILTGISVYYWAAIGNARPLSEVPLFYRYTYRFFPFADILFSVAGMMLFYKGLRRLRE
jgi:hypothetical protein